MNVDDIQNYEEELQKIENLLDECQEEIEQKTLHISNLLTQIGRLQELKKNNKILIETFNTHERRKISRRIKWIIS